MLKHFIALIILSLLVILAAPYCHQALELLLSAHQTVLQLFGHIFAGSSLGTLLQRLLTLLIIPIVIGAVIATIYWGIKRSQTAYVVHITWIIWIILATALIMQIA